MSKTIQIKKNYNQRCNSIRQSINLIKIQGVTLVEIIVVLVIIGIITSIGIPSFNTLILNNRISSQTNTVIGSFHFARNEALKRADFNIVLCATEDYLNCAATGLGADIEWEKGWMIFNDANSDGVFNNSPGSEEMQFKVYEKLSGDNTLRTTVNSEDVSMFTFTQEGVNTSNTFFICDERGDEHAKAIIFNVTATTRIGVDEDDPSDDIVNDHQGNNIICP